MAAPIMLGGVMHFILTFTDTAFLGRLGETALNAAGNGGLLYMTLLIFIQGISDGLQILVARRNSEKRFSDVGNLLVQSVFTLFTFGVALYFIMFFGKEPLIKLITVNEELQVHMNAYLDYRILGFFFASVYLSLLGFYTGIGKTRVLIVFTAITALLNVGLDYCLIFGKFGFPRMEEAGAGLASSIAESVTTIIAFIVIIKGNLAKKFFEGVKFRIQWFRIKALLILSAPIMGQRLVSLSAWTIFFFFIEKMGSHDLAISQLVRTLYFLTFIPVMGFSVTARTYTSHYMGLKQPEMVLKALKKITILGTGITILFVHGFWFYPEFMLGLLTTDQSLIDDTVSVLQIITFSMLLFTLSFTFYSGISGVGDTKSSFLVEFISIICYLTGAFFLVNNNATITQVWCLEFLYFGLLTILSLSYFRFAKWRTIEI